MKTRNTLSIVAMAVMVFTGCQKEKAFDGIRLIAERLNSNQKVAVNGTAASWVDGESLYINGAEKTIDVDGSVATVTGVTEAEHYYAVYPADIYSSNDGDSYTLNIPASYTYAKTGSLQSLATPMVAYSSGNELFFKHVTAAVGVQIKNDFGIDVRVTNITISSNAYKLCGSTTVTLGSSITVDAETSDDADLRTVQMNFSETQLLINSGVTATVQVPVLPVGNDNRFTISVTVQNKDDADMVYTFSKTQTGEVSGDHAYDLNRAEIGYAPAKFGGVFSVASGKQVRFAPGNLQYQASTGTWRFAKHQYDYIGNAAGNNVFDDTRSTQAAWIDLFGWGTSGWVNRDANDGKDTIIYYRPYDYIGTTSSSSAYGYGPRHKNGYSYVYTFSLVGDYANSDWGVYNAISNGGNMPGQWRTITGGADAEWAYLMSSRNTSTISGVNNARYLKAKVAGVNGYIVFPDEFTLPDGVSVTSNHINLNSYLAWSSVTTSLSASDWAKMEVAGAIFLPCTGYRSYSSNNPSFTADYGYYWSSTFQGTSNAYYAQMGSGTPSFTGNTPKRLGCSVRLVRDVQ